MLVFHEGLPGGGKTYEAVCKHILPAIEQNRHVYTNVEGLESVECQQAISNVLGIPLITVQSLIHFLDDDKIYSIWEHVPANALVIIDEIQNYYGVRDKVSKDLTQWVVEHRHQGIDILAIGQELKDVNALFKRRVDRKIKFHKLDALGAVSRYRWVAYKSQGEMKFIQTTQGVAVYEERFFACYKSHVSDDVNTAVYADKRIVIWNSPLMRLVIVFVVLGSILFPYYLYRQFQPENSSLINAPVDSQHEHTNKSVVLTSVNHQPLVKPASDQNSVSAKSRGMDYAEYLSMHYRVRLVSVLVNRHKQAVTVEWRDDSLRVQDRMDDFSLSYLGWRVQVITLTMIKMTKGTNQIIVTPWPLDVVASVSTEENRRVSEEPIDRHGKLHGQAKNAD